jgi:ATP synthase protein I
MESKSNDRNSLAEPVRRERARRELWARHGERSLGQNLAWIGVLGWLVVVPMLIGIFVGRWLDKIWGMGIFWTVSLLFLGVVAGCALAWQRMHEG